MPCCRCARGRAGQGSVVVLERGKVAPPLPPPAQLSPALSPQAVLKRGLKPSCTILPLMKKDHRDNLEFLLTNLGKLHLTG